MINTYEEIKNFREAVDNFVNIINRQNDIISNLEMKLNEKDGINWYHHGFKVTKKIYGIFHKELKKGKQFL